MMKRLIPRAPRCLFSLFGGLSLLACSSGSDAPPSGAGGASGGVLGAGGATGSGGTGDTSGGSNTGGTTTTTGGAGGSLTDVRETMYVEGREIRDPCGAPVVLKGPNHMAIYADRSGAAIPEIAKTNANTVRIMWFATHGVAIDEADAIVSKSVEAGMVPILEMHDATGPSNWGNMDAIVDYWTSEAAVAFVAKHEASFILNIANEAGLDAGGGYDEFEAVYRDAITRIRDATIRVPIMIDASGWGRDHESLFTKGRALLDHDPLHNVIFSWHAYDPLDATEVTNVLERAVELDLPFVVGEFANRSPVGTCGPALEYKHIIAEANRLSIGWLPWSWGLDPAESYANADCWEFDMSTTLAFESLERWGEEVAVSDPNSMVNTSERTYFLENGSCQ